MQWFDGTTRLFSSASTVLLFAASNQVEVQLAGGEVQRLGLHDCLRLEGNDALVGLEVQGRFCLIELISR
ncbi:hypothetical protein D3C81_2151310 [compost metagenome]